MEVMFVKDYVDTDSYDMPVFVKATTKGILLDECTNKIYIEEIKATLDFVDKNAYAPIVEHSFAE